jgi:hypothetical protein
VVGGDYLSNLCVCRHCYFCVFLEGFQSVSIVIYMDGRQTSEQTSGQTSGQMIGHTIA